MIKITRRQTRTSVDVPFFKVGQTKERLAKIKEKYIMTGALIKFENILSPDQLQIESILYWRSIEDYCNFIIDEDCHEVDLGGSDLGKIKESNLKIRQIVEVIND